MTNIPTNYLLSQNINYESLPLIPKKNFKDRALTIFINVPKINPLCTIFATALLFFLIEKKKTRTTLHKQSTILGQNCIEEKEKQICQIAQKMGISTPFKLNTSKKAGCLAASGKNCIHVDPRYLFEKKDLPPELSLSLIDEQEISEEEWILKYAKWSYDNFKLSLNFKSQLQIDTAIEYGREILDSMRNFLSFEERMGGALVHEFSHCVKRHTRTQILTHLFFDLLILPTVGTSFLMKKYVLGKLTLKQEKAADLFAKEKMCANSLIYFFQKLQIAGKALHSKYPDRFDSNGNNKCDKSHPALSKRIQYLTK